MRFDIRGKLLSASSTDLDYFVIKDITQLLSYLYDSQFRTVRIYTTPLWTISNHSL